MATTMINNLKPGDGDVAIEIKVIRKWITYGKKKSDCCYIFLGKNGDAIEAYANFSLRSYFDSIIKVDSCYRLSNYICESEKTFFVSVPHKTRIKLGKAAQFEKIAGHEFPTYHFNFTEYDQLKPRVDSTNILTDYIGRVENVYEVTRTKGTTIVKVKLENLSGNMIEATFWDEAAMSFNKEAIQALPSPVIAAVTSMKVSEYQEILQLTATPASYIYINPAIPEAASMATDFVVRDNVNPVLKIQYEKTKDIETEKQRNRFTLASLLSQNPDRYRGVLFTCKAALVKIDESKGWFYKACDQWRCRRKLQKRGQTLACENHGEVTKPNHLYFINARMADDTAETKIVFFDDAASMLLNKPCTTMIDECGYTDPFTLPEPINILRGQTKIFQLRYAKFCEPGTIDFVAEAVFEDANVSNDERATSASNKALIPTIDPSPTTPTTLKTICVEQLTTPITPPPLTDTPPQTYLIAQPTETKNTQPKSKKQLFQTSSGPTNEQPLKKQKEYC